MSKFLSFLKYLAKRFSDRLADKTAEKFAAIVIFFILIFLLAIYFKACSPVPTGDTTLQQSTNTTINVQPRIESPLFQINWNSNNTTIIITPPYWIMTHVETKDRCGKGLGITLGALSDSYRWIYESDSKVGISLNESLDIETVIAAIPNTVAQPVIAVGLASHEHPQDNPAEEISRAQRRVDKLIALSDRHFKVNHPELYSLNLGYYTKQSELSREQSAIERRVILIEVTHREDNAELNSGVRNALIAMMEKKSLVEGFDPDKYSNFTEDKFIVKPRSPTAHNELTPCKDTAQR